MRQEEGEFHNFFLARLVEIDGKEEAKRQVQGCEFADVCQYTKIGCEVDNKYNCTNRHEWKYVGVSFAFKDLIDEDGNYTLLF
jgi:hypothetical protein